MRVRSLLTLVALSAVALAGCADSDEANQSIVDPEPLLDPIGTVQSHPAYGFATNAALRESPDGATGREVLDNGTVVWYKPAFRGLPNAISGLEPLTQVDEARTAGGIAVFGPLAFLGGRGSGPLYIYDIMDPENPFLLSETPDVPVRDADTIHFPDGRLVLITTAGGSNIFATDVTDPANVTLIGNFETPGSNHNIAVVPGTPIVYNMGMDIVDFSDPADPQLVGEFPDGDGCHDIAFHINSTAGKVWALCAGYAQTEIWDIQDPLAPELLVAIDYPSAEKGVPVVGGMLDDQGVPQDVGKRDVPCTSVPLPTGGRVNTPCSTSAAFPLSFSHLAIVNHDATVLIMGDETGGGGINGCDFYYEGPDGTTYSGPIGNLWFYDITDPEEPDLRGHVSPGNQDADGSCTAHFGKVIGETNMLVMAFYSAGITLVDFNDLDNPRIVDRWDADGDIWDVWYYQGYLFTGDMSRGMDVLALS